MKDDEKVIDLGKEFKKEERRKKIEEFKQKAKDIWDEHKMTIIVLAPVAGKVIKEVVKAVGRHHNLKLEERSKDHRVWDPTIGHYWELRRKLDNRDWTEINRRHSRGESLGEILESLRVLK